MKLVALHIARKDNIWRLEADYEGMDGNVQAARIYTWSFLSSTDALTKAGELVNLEQN